MSGAEPGRSALLDRPRGGLLGSGLVRSADGEPLRPGGLALTEQLLEWAEFAPGDVVVDVGCGQGASVELMRRRGLRPIGIDAAAAPIETAARRTQAALVVAAGSALPFRAACCDGLLSECSLSVIGRRRQTLADWWRVLRPGGRLIMSDIYRRANGGGVASTPELSMMAPAPAIVQDVTAVGFRVVRFEDRSDVLKSWAARFIFAYGSLDALWQECCGGTAGAVHAMAPGYFVMLAVKPPEPSAEGRP
jgi:ubiquinone/menaquinone biosynthesis C-methylase UbiE